MCGLITIPLIVVFGIFGVAFVTFGLSALTNSVTLLISTVLVPVVGLASLIVGVLLGGFAVLGMPNAIRMYRFARSGQTLPTLITTSQQHTLVPPTQPVHKLEPGEYRVIQASSAVSDFDRVDRLFK